MWETTLPREDSKPDHYATGDMTDEMKLLMTSYHDCDNKEANCQCSKYKVDIQGLCGRGSGCYKSEGQEACEKHHDKWLGPIDQKDIDYHIEYF